MDVNEKNSLLGHNSGDHDTENCEDNHPNYGSNTESPRNRHSSLSRSWSGGTAMSPHDDMTHVKKQLTSSLNLQPNGQVVLPVVDNSYVNGQTPFPPDDTDKLGKLSESERKRLKCRLLVSSSVTLLCYITGYISLIPVQSQYLFQRFAEDRFNLTNVTEGQLQVPCSNEVNGSLQQILNEIQSDTSRQTLYMDYAQYGPALLVTVILGSYTDYLGRRFMVILPCLGAFLKSVVFLLVIYLHLDVDYLYIAYALDGVCGSIYALTLGLTAAVADITTTSSERAFTFALLEGSLAVAGSVSQISVGFLIRAVGYLAPAVAITVLLFLALVSVFLFMPETLRRPTHIVLNPVVHLRKVFGFYILDGTARQRFLFLCGLVIYFFVVLVTLGKMSVETLYEINSPFCWDSVQIGVFGGLKMLVQVTGCVVAVKVLQACVRIEIIALLGFASGIASYVVEAFAYTDWMMYLVPVAGLFAMVVNPLTRALMSRMAPTHSQGALFASMAAIETVCHLASTTMYNTVYMATLQVFTGAVFLLMASFCFIDFVLIIVFMVVSRKAVFYESVTDYEASVEPPAHEAGIHERTSLLGHGPDGKTANAGLPRQRGISSENDGDSLEQSTC